MQLQSVSIFCVIYTQQMYTFFLFWNTMKSLQLSKKKSVLYMYLISIGPNKDEDVKVKPL